MSRFSLNGQDWKLIYVRNEQFVQDGLTADMTELKRRGYTEIPATVPGNLELDLMAAGKKEDPFWSTNSRDRSCEYLHLFYCKTFSYDGKLEAPRLVFEGLDTVADIYMNGQLLAAVANMNITHVIPVEQALKNGENLLVVHIKPAVLEARKYPLSLHDTGPLYNLEALHIRKAAHMFGWDIMPRIVSAGIWRPIYLEDHPKDTITEFYMAANSIQLAQKTAEMHCFVNLELGSDDILRYQLRIQGSCGDSSFEKLLPLYHTSAHWNMTVENVKFWWPLCSGDANLYDVTVTLLKDGLEVANRTTRLGIRTVELERTSLTDAEGKDGKFCFIVNGKRTFCRGTNWVPVDALHSRDGKRIGSILPMLSDLNCNMIRIWGGNVYEADELYDFCDENGIMIWQDFLMGCGTYPQDDNFARQIGEEATFAVKRLRSHASIVLWAGNNENDCAYGWATLPRNPNQDRISREVLPNVLRMHDFYRPYLPSSPYIDEIAWERQDDDHRITEEHLWGPRDYFKGEFYGKSICQFASETGYHGCPSPEALRKFIPAENLWTSTNSDHWDGIDNRDWLAHATTMSDNNDPYKYRIRLMADQVTTLFGNTVPNTLDDFARASQISQAEAKKYFIERFRVTKWRRTGIIWWNLIDGWPQISDAIVDYNFYKKLAYHYIKRSQQAICLICDEPKDNLLSLFAVNDTPQEAHLSYTVTEVDSGKVVASGMGRADASTLLCRIPVQSDERKFYLMEWTLDGRRFSNHYMTGLKDINYSKYLSAITACGYDQFEGF